MGKAFCLRQIYVTASSCIMLTGFFFLLISDKICSPLINMIMCPRPNCHSGLRNGTGKPIP